MNTTTGIRVARTVLACPEVVVVVVVVVVVMVVVVMVEMMSE